MFSGFFKSKSRGHGKDKEITLVAESGGDPVLVLRSILVKHSAVLRKMAENGELKKSKEVKLRGITPVGLHKIAEYIKTESVSFQNHLEAIETLRAAYLYQVEAMTDVCSNFLITVIDHENVCDIFEFACSYYYHQVEYSCLRFIDYQAKEILKSTAFLNLKRMAVTDIVKRQSLNVPTEGDVFRAILDWGINDCSKRDIDVNNVQEIFKTIKPLLVHVRFLAMSDEELSDPEVNQYHRLMTEDSSSKGRSRFGSEARSLSIASDTLSMQPREYVLLYNYDLEIVKFDDHAVKNGESFFLRVEILKGRLFLTGITLAFERFVSTKNTCCLYVALSATNVQTADQKSGRGTFMSSDEESALVFPSPLMASESQRLEIVVHVKRAVNICTAVISSDVQIVMPDRKDVAMKVLPSSTAGGTERSMIRSITYFY